MGKIKIIVPLLALSFLLASCDSLKGSESKSSNGSSSIETSSTTSSFTGTSSLPPSVEIEKGHSPQEVIDMSLELAKSEYRLITWESTSPEVTNEQVWNDRYVSYGNSGYVALDAWDKKEGRYLYSYSRYEDGYHLGASVTTNSSEGFPIPATSVLDVSNLALLITEEGWGFSANNLIAIEDGTYATTNYYARMAYSYALGAGMYAYYGYVARIVFAFLSDGTFKVNVEGILQEGSYLPLVEGIFSEVGTAKDPALEAHFKDFSLPEETPTEASLSKILKEELRIETTVTRYTSLDLESWTSVEEGSAIVSYGKGDYTALIYDAEENLISRNDFLTMDGVFYERGLALNNEITNKISSYTNDSFYRLKNIMTPEAYRKESDGGYRYYGSDYSSLIYSVYPAGMSETLESITLIEHSGVIDEMCIRSVVYTNGQTYYYLEISAKLRDKIEIPDREPLTLTEPEDEIEAALSKWDENSCYAIRFSEGNSPYLTTSSEFTDFTYDGVQKAVLIEEYQHGFLAKRYGYREVSEGMITPFEEVDGLLVATSLPYEGSITDFLLNLNPSMFQTKNYQIEVKDGITSLEGAGYLGLKSSVDYYLTGSLTLKITGDGEDATLTGFTYAFMKGAYGERYIHAEINWNKQGISEDYDLSSIEPYHAPTSWKEESSSIGTLLTTLFPEVEIPYLYDASLEGSWKGKTAGGVVTLYNTEESSTFLSSYIALLLSKGYLLGEDGTYQNGIVSIEVGETLSEGIRIRRM